MFDIRYKKIYIKDIKVNSVISRERITLNNIVSVLKQKMMLDNKSQVEKYKEEIIEKENYISRFVFSCSSLPPSFLYSFVIALS